MSSYAIAAAAKLVGKLAIEEVQLLAKVRDKVEQLQHELEWMQCFLLDADKQQNKDATVRKWVSEIRDLALEAEDVIEIYILEVSRKRERPRPGVLVPWTDLKWLLCFCGDAKALHIVGSSINDLTQQIKQLNSRLQTYGIKHSYDRDLMLSEQRRTYSHTEDDDVVGLDEHVKDVADKLVNGQQKVVVIYGMGGIGKTTLAREVYNHAPLKTQFEGFAWAYVSQQLQFGSVCRDILLQLIPSNNKEERKSVLELPDSQLATKLYHLLKRTRCLVVLDDIWSVQDWDRLKHALPLIHHSCDDPEAKLLLTTRHSQIFSGLPSRVVYYHEAHFLRPDSSWQLFQKKADIHKDSAEPWKVDLGEKMLDHCKGHPLAIVVLGCVLATKTTLQEWQSVSENVYSNLKGGGYTGVYKVLGLSYDELPYHLKACFLNFGHFHENYEIPAERLYHLWIAEGIISSTQDQDRGKRQSLEDIAKVYLNELVQRGMVQVVSMGPDGDIEMCKLHDLMQDKCLEIAREENFLQTIDEYAVVDDSEQHQGADLNHMLHSRRLAVIVGSHGVQKYCSNSLTLPRLRSLLLFHTDLSPDENCDWVKGVSKNFQLLRILDCTGCSQLSGRLHSDIGSLVYLRYLSLNGTRITDLPSEIGNLRSLLILDLRVLWPATVELPNVIWKIKSLRQLYLPTIPYCYKIEKIKLYGLSKLEVIEGLDLDRVDVEGLQKLTSLQKLIAHCTHSDQGLYPFLRSSSIKRMSLHVGASMFVGLSAVLSGCHFLTDLYISDGGGERVQLPITHGKMIPESLEVIGFADCEISEDWISALEKHPRLNGLSLINCYEVSELHISSKGFPMLSYLWISDLKSLREWTVEKGGLPRLKQLRIYDSPIEMLPDALPPHVSIECSPCVRGINRYGACPYARCQEISTISDWETQIHVSPPASVEEERQSPIWPKICHMSYPIGPIRAPCTVSEDKDDCESTAQPGD